MTKNNDLANLLFPHVTKSVEDLEKQFPKRNLPQDAIVTRFAPSPTGYVHVGSLYTSNVARLFAVQSGGVFYLRIEDTDTEREVKDSTKLIPQTLLRYGVNFSEGITPEGEEIGAYGPYKQTERKDIYHVVAKEMVRRGHAYPCFCTEKELTDIRAQQEMLKVNTGYYGAFAKCRHLTYDEVENNIASGKPFVLRLKAPEHEGNALVTLTDEVRGTMNVPQNFMDEVILKSTTQIPTYHFAHVVDDHFMRTTHIFRGDEWIATWPLHAQMFDMLDFERPKYAHIAPIMKLDGTSRTKLSKRDGAAMHDFEAKGYPSEVIMEYLMTITNSNFEDWRRENPDLNYTQFPVSFAKMSNSGALMDWDKLNDIAKNIISNYTANEQFDRVCDWSKNHDPKLYQALKQNPNYSVAVLSIDKTGDRIRKDLAKWSDVSEHLGFMFSDYYYSLGINDFEIVEKVNPQLTRDLLTTYTSMINTAAEQSEWFATIKELSAKFGFSTDMKDYRKNPENYKGSVADVSGIIRVAVTGKQKTSDLYLIILTLGQEETIKRINNFLKVFHLLP